MLEFLNPENLAAISPLLVYGGLFVVCILEGIPLIGSLVAGGTIVIGIGTLVSAGVINPVLGILVASLGSWAGDLFGFFTVRRYAHRVPFLKKIVANVQKNEGQLSEVFDRRYFLITVASRLIPFVRSTPSLVGSIRAIPAWKHVTASLVASLIWATAGIFIGHGLSKVVDAQYIIIAAIALCVVSMVIGIAKYKKQKLF